MLPIRLSRATVLGTAPKDVVAEPHCAVAVLFHVTLPFTRSHPSRQTPFTTGRGSASRALSTPFSALPSTDQYRLSVPQAARPAINPGGERGTSRFSRTKTPCMPWFFDRAGAHQQLARNVASSVAFRSFDNVGTPIPLISRLNSPAYTYPCERFAHALADADASLGVNRGSLALRCRAFSSPSPCRFIPALRNSTAGL